MAALCNREKSPSKRKEKHSLGWWHNQGRVLSEHAVALCWGLCPPSPCWRRKPHSRGPDACLSSHAAPTIPSSAVSRGQGDREATRLAWASTRPQLGLDVDDLARGLLWLEIRDSSTCLHLGTVGQMGLEVLLGRGQRSGWTRELTFRGEEVTSAFQRERPRHSSSPAGQQGDSLAAGK